MKATQLVIHVVSGDEKHVAIRVNDVENVLKNAGDTADANLFRDVVEFCEDVLGSNADAATVEITPANAADVLGAPLAASSPTTSTPVASPPAASTADPVPSAPAPALEQTADPVPSA